MSEGDAEDGQAGVRALVDLDRIVHEPARLAILTVLAQAEEVEFRFVETVTGLTRGNLSSHASKLENAGYIEVEKAFRRRTPVTRYRITPAGRKALADYRDRLRAVVDPAATES